MDEFMFKGHLKACNYVPEATGYLEMFNYTDEACNTDEEHSLTLDEFENFLHRRGAFEPPKPRDGVQLTDGMRLVLQKAAKHPETFTPNYLTLPPEMYRSMVETLNLPMRAIEGTSVVGPFFWAALDEDPEDPHLHIVFRKSDVRKKGKTRGWELMLSHSFKDSITTGFVKGTPSSDIVNAIEHLRECHKEIAHPLLLPIIILAHDLDFKTDQKQRDARDWLRRLEHAVTMRNEIDEKDTYKDFDLDTLNRDLVECHSQVLWKRPQAYQEIIKEIKRAMDMYWEGVQEQGKTPSPDVRKLHNSVKSRLEFYRTKLTGLENYIHTTLERLSIQRQALYNIIAQKESKLNLEMAAQQRRLAHASKRDGTAMKTLSLLGAVFLPGTFLSSVFSMTFFDFSGGGSSAAVSIWVWVYFVITIPLTALIVGSWWLMEKRRERHYRDEDVEIEKGIDQMETDIMAIMRKRTMKKASTWTSAQSPSMQLTRKEDKDR